MSNLPRIIFDAERMKYPHTGIYHYCRQLGHALISQQQEHVPQLGFYLPANAEGVFGKEAHTIRQMPVHRFFKPFVNKYKVWHVTNQVTNYFPFNSRQKILLTVHDLNFLHERKSAAKQRQYLSSIRKKVERANTIIAISEFVKNEIISNLHIDGIKIRVIYNGCNISGSTIAAAPEYPINFPFIFTLGAITAKKNFAVLPAAIVGNDLHFVFAGVIQSKAYFNEIFDKAKKLGVENKVHYIGPVFEPQKHWLMEHCKAFAFPSLAEGFGLPVIEAMRFGKPVVLSKATSLPEIGGEAAFYLNNFEPEHVRQTIEQAIETFDVNRKQATIQRSYQFDWQIAAKAYWDIYEDLCEAT